MQKTLHTTAALSLMCFLAGACLGQSLSKEQVATSLCSLQQKVTEGNHETVRVSGIYGPGLSHTILEDPACPAESSWVELDLRSEQNKQKLRRLLNHSRRAYVVLDGEFYGPPVPDPKLPEALRKSYHPGWGHLAAFKTKLVVHAIRDVKAVPPKRMTIPPPPNQFPQLTHEAGFLVFPFCVYCAWKKKRGQACDFAILLSQQFSRLDLAKDDTSNSKSAPQDVRKNSCI